MPKTLDTNALLRRAVSITKAAAGCGLQVLDIRCVWPGPNERRLNERRLQVTFGVRGEPYEGSPYLGGPADDAGDAAQQLDDLVLRNGGSAS